MHSPLIELALRTAAVAHRSQMRKGSDTPYITHPSAVMMILLRSGFSDDELLAAALLHDVVEDTDITLEQLQWRFPPRVCDLVAAVTEKKLDDAGQKRPWHVRKADKLASLRTASPEVLALALADKVHNLSTVLFDLRNDAGIWSHFTGTPQETLRNYADVAALVDGQPDARLQQLACEVRRLIAEIESLSSAASQA
jgi:(p)ppGpp synthase/HD superfamily hydrolase